MELTVLQWNIWMNQDVRDIINFLLPLEADIICLQELTGGLKNQVVKHGPDYVAKKLGYNYHYQALPIASTEGLPRMLANGIFSRFPITAKTFSWINRPGDAGGNEDEYRAYIEITLNIGGREVTVGTTHMLYTHRFKETAQKQLETDHFVGIISHKGRNYILTGDLNALPDSYTVTNINKLLRHAGPGFNQKTWTTKPFSYQGFEETELNWRLDYVFVSKDIEVVSSEILRTDYSDHLPILTRIKIN